MDWPAAICSRNAKTQYRIGPLGACGSGTAVRCHPDDSSAETEEIRTYVLDWAAAE
jgi:hypothetical protein